MIRKTILLLIAVVSSMSVNAQLIEVYRNGTLEQSYTSDESDSYKVVFKTGRDYVEIGGVKWATMNIGATTVADSRETAYGDYFALGEVDTYYSKIDYNTPDGTPKVVWDKNSTRTHIFGEKTAYDCTNYCGSATFKEWSPCPYDDVGSHTYKFKPEYDVARAKWGGNWHMPQGNDMQNLYSACGGHDEPSPVPSNITKGGVYLVPAKTLVDGTTYNVAGLLFVAKEDINKRLFFPCAGRIKGTELIESGSYGYYWYPYLAGAPDMDPNYARNLSIRPNDFVLYDISDRYIGLTVRPVLD